MCNNVDESNLSLHEVHLKEGINPSIWLYITFFLLQYGQIWYSNAPPLHPLPFVLAIIPPYLVVKIAINITKPKTIGIILNIDWDGLFIINKSPNIITIPILWGNKLKMFPPVFG